MPSRLVNHTLDSIVQGVSEQYQEGRFESQVERMVNCFPTLSRGVMRRNPIDTAWNLTFDNTLNDPFTYVYDKGTPNEQYMIVIPGTPDNKWYVFSLTDPTKYWSGEDDYLTVPANGTAKQTFRAITLGDVTFITNTTITVKASSEKNEESKEAYYDWAFYWIKLTTQVVTKQKTKDTDTGSRLEGYTYWLKEHTKYKVEAVKDTRPGEHDPDLIKAEEIAAKLASYDSNWEHIEDTGYVYSRGPKDNWEGGDSNGDTASIAVWKTVQHDSDLPATLPDDYDGFIVRVVGSGNTDKDDYYLKYNQEDKTWVECAIPDISKGLDTTTMPHCIYSLGDLANRSFVFDEYKLLEDEQLTDKSGWQNREVGDEETNKDPKFVGNTIQNLFFFKNRFGFISENTITLSRVAEYGGLYLDTIQVVKDDGPINIYVATSDVNKLRSAVPTASTLVIFADQAQFTLTSGSQPLTPLTATINLISNYDYSPLVDAIGFENKIVYTSTNGGYSQILEMDLEEATNTRGLLTSSEIISNHIPTFIPKEIQSITRHTVNGYIFFHTNLAINLIYIVTMRYINKDRVQLAFHNWEFEKNIAGIHEVDNYLYILFTDGVLGRMTLEIPGRVDNILYQDKISESTSKSFISGVWFSNFYFRDSRKLGSNRGRFQLRTMLFSVPKYSKFQVSLTTPIPFVSEGQDASCFYPEWNDSLPWRDEIIWVDVIPTYARTYFDDKKITISADNENIKAIFHNNGDAGFILETINVEALFYQRSTRT